MIRGQEIAKYLSSNHDPLYRFHQWQANLRALGIAEIKTVPYVPLSHPFVEPLIGTIHRESLDKIVFWNEADLEMKLSDFKDYYNRVYEHSRARKECCASCRHPIEVRVDRLREAQP